MENKNIKLPEAIYFDTNVLMSFLSESSIRFMELRDLANSKGIKLFVPEVVALEVSEKWIKGIEEELSKMKTAAKNVGKKLWQGPISFEVPNNVRSKVSAKLAENKNEYGMELVSTPDNISIHRLVDMAVKKIPPFEEKKEKGFRDSIIMFTILGHCQENGFTNVMFVSNDRIFGEDAVREQFSASGINWQVADELEKAKNEIEVSLDAIVQGKIEQDIKSLRKILQKNLHEISAFVIENSEVNEPFLRNADFFSPDSGVQFDTIKNVLDVRPVRLGKIYPDVLFSKDKEVDRGRPVTFGVVTEFDLLVETSSFATIFGLDGPKFPLSSPKAFEKLPPRDYSRVEGTKTISREIMVEGLIIEESGEEQLQLLRTSP